jgi:hypothetical protein
MDTAILIGELDASIARLGGLRERIAKKGVHGYLLLMLIEEYQRISEALASVRLMAEKQRMEGK